MTVKKAKSLGLNRFEKMHLEMDNLKDIRLWGARSELNCWVHRLVVSHGTSVNGKPTPESVKLRQMLCPYDKKVWDTDICEEHVLVASHKLYRMLPRIPGVR